MVLDPVDASLGVVAVVASMDSPPDSTPRRGDSRVLPLRLCARGLLLRSLLSHGGQEKRLVDTPVEDRDAQLYALRNDRSAVQASLARELRGRQMNRQNRSPPRVRPSIRPETYRCERTGSTQSTAKSGFLGGPIRGGVRGGGNSGGSCPHPIEVHRTRAYIRLAR